MVAAALMQWSCCLLRGKHHHHVITKALTAVYRCAMHGATEQRQRVSGHAGMPQVLCNHSVLLLLLLLLLSPPQVVGLLLDHPGWRSVLEAQPGHVHQLLAALLVTFDSRLWHPASGVLLK
jgi:hypothetical protein